MAKLLVREVRVKLHNMAKKRFTFAMAKERIKELEEALEAANVDLTDNVVTSTELKWLRFYKIGFIVLLISNVLFIIA